MNIATVLWPVSFMPTLVGTPELAMSVVERWRMPCVPTKVGMKLTGHKTVAMFMHYVHTEDKPVRDAAELVASRRQAITGAQRPAEATA